MFHSKSVISTNGGDFKQIRALLKELSYKQAVCKSAWKKAKNIQSWCESTSSLQAAKAFGADFDCEFSSFPAACYRWGPIEGWVFNRHHHSTATRQSPPQSQRIQPSGSLASAPQPGVRTAALPSLPSHGVSGCSGWKELCLCLWGYGTEHVAPGIIQLPYLASVAQGRGSCALLPPPKLTSHGPSCTVGSCRQVWTKGSREEGWPVGLQPLHHLKKLLVNREAGKLCKKPGLYFQTCTKLDAPKYSHLFNQ